MNLGTSYVHGKHHEKIIYSGSASEQRGLLKSRATIARAEGLTRKREAASEISGNQKEPHVQRTVRLLLMISCSRSV